MSESSDPVATFLESEFPGAAVTPLSRSNNDVVRVDFGSRRLVVKHVLDHDIPLDYMVMAAAHLGDRIPVQEILRIFQRADGALVDAVVSTYVEGVDLAEATGGSSQTLSPQRLATYFCDYLVACQDMPRMNEGYGAYKRSAPVTIEYRDFVVGYAQKYWSRARPLYDGTDVVQMIDTWVTSTLPYLAKSMLPDFVTVPIDSNLKNFILTNEGQLVALNVPIAAKSTAAHGVGAVAAHLRNTKFHAPFLAEAESRFGSDAARLAPHFEFWALLGIMSFYAVRSPQDRELWRNWGSPVGLDVDLQCLARQLSPAVLETG